LTKVGIDGVSAWPAHLTFAIARHAAVDLVQVFGLRPDRGVDRLPPDERAALRATSRRPGSSRTTLLTPTPSSSGFGDRYEPYVAALSNRF